MSAQRFAISLSFMLFAGAAGAAPAGAAAEPLQPFGVQDMVRMERISEVAVAPDGKRVAYTQRSTDMEANKGRTSIWLDTGKRGAAPLRLTDGSANASQAQWSMDGRFVYFLSNRGGTSQVWRLASGGGPGVATPGVATPGVATQVADPTQVTNLPLDVGSFRVSPKDDRILVSLEVFLDCADLSCSKQRLDTISHSAATGVLYKELFVRHWDAWSDGRRAQLFAMT
ncbi:MAG: TolB family protein, partial [Steroidobacteraceae bacterium]